MISRRRLFLVLVASIAVLLGAAMPVLADHSPEHTTDQITAVVSQAGAQMDEIVSGFAAHIDGLSEESQVDQSAEDATTAVEEVWNSARTAVQDLVNLFPGQLGQVGGDAKQQLQDARQTARSTISELAAAWVPPIPVPSSTTTTTAPNEGPPPGAGQGNGTDTNPGHGNGTDTNPGNGNGTEPNPGNGNGPEPNQGNDPAPSVVVGPPVDRSPSSTADPPVEPIPAIEPSEISFDLAATTPDQPFTVSPETITTLLAAEETGATATMAAMLETVLSPALVDLVLSPLLILEILLRTLIDGGQRLIGPLTLLVASALAIFGYDRLSRHNLFLDRV